MPLIPNDISQCFLYTNKSNDDNYSEQLYTY